MVQLYDSGGLCGYDYEGCPVWYDLVGVLDPKGLLLSASKQELIRKRIKTFELLLKECELQSQKVSDWHRGSCPCFPPAQHSRLSWEMSSPPVIHPQTSNMCMTFSAGMSLESLKPFPLSSDLE